MKTKIFEQVAQLPYPGMAAVIQKVNDQQCQIADQQRQIDTLTEIVAKICSSSVIGDQPEKPSAPVLHGKATPLMQIKAGVLSQKSGGTTNADAR